MLKCAIYTLEQKENRVDHPITLLNSEEMTALAMFQLIK